MASSRTKLILFDIDGTLVKVLGAGRRALADAFTLVFERPDAIAHLDPDWFAGKTDLYIFRQVALDAGVTTWDYDRRYADLETTYLELLRRHVEAHPDAHALPGAEALLVALSAQGERGGPALGLMTGNIEAGARVKLDPFGLNRFFPSGGFGSDALDRADIGRVARGRFERRIGATIEPHEVVVVGDTPADIAAARTCGFRVLAVASGWNDPESLQAASPDMFVLDLNDTAGLVEVLN
jgi:phosphoglycolate phosphatase